MRCSLDLKGEFLDSTFRFVHQAIGASHVTFYSVDPDQNIHDFVSWRVSADFLRLYEREMHEVDPLHVRRVARAAPRVLRMSDARRYASARETAEYGRFVARFSYGTLFDFLFYRDGVVTSGMTAIWARDEPQPGEDQYALALHLHDYIEFNLDRCVGAGEPDIPAAAAGTLHLTARERDVASLVCCGRTNADIATCLGIGVATVKTHLLHIFEKAGVENRSGLVARVSRHL